MKRIVAIFVGSLVLIILISSILPERLSYYVNTRSTHLWLLAIADFLGYKIAIVGKKERKSDKIFFLIIAGIIIGSISTVIIRMHYYTTIYNTNPIVAFFSFAIMIIALGGIVYIIYKVHNYVPYKSNTLKENQSAQSSTNALSESVRKNINFDNMDGHTFELFCADLLRINEFTNVKVTSGSGDQGIDITAEKGDVKYAFQCKRWESSVGNSALREAFAGKAFYHCDIGVVMTNSNFTSKAKQYAKETGIRLWDRKKIYELMKNLYEETEAKYI